MKIAICEDEEVERTLFASYVADWGENKNIPLQITCFSNPASLLTLVEKGGYFDLFILDIMMKPINGVELAKELRTFNQSASLLFVTATPQYMSMGYELEASHYLLKPVSKKQFHKGMDLAYKNYDPSTIPFIIQDHQQIISVETSNIMFIESFGHTSMIHTTNDTYTMRASLKSIAKTLRPPLFLMPHRSYLVNLNYVQSIAGTNIILKNDTSIPISRAKNKEIRQQYLRFFSGAL